MLRRNDHDSRTARLSRDALRAAVAREARKHVMGTVELPAGPDEFAHIAEGIAWATFVDAHVARFATTLGVPLGSRLGCGRYGCVFESESPWVVKITRDESEGPVWAYIQELLGEPLEDGEEGDTGAERYPSFLAVRDVVRVRPDVVFNREEQPVYAIVREEAEPVFTSVERSSPDGTPSYHDGLSEMTLAILGLTPERLAEAGLTHPVLYSDVARVIDTLPRGVQIQFGALLTAVNATGLYRVAADKFHSLRWRPLRLQEEEAPFDEIVIAQQLADDALASMARAWAILRKNPLGHELGLTLERALADADLAFRDLHRGNIGWRTHPVIDGVERPECLVILDPGVMATPVVPSIRELEFLANAGRYLKNQGIL